MAWTPVLLWVSLGLFVCRVLGQLIVSLYPVSWLPPMSVWYSGLVPYPVLLPAQILLATVMATMAVGVTSSIGPFGRPNPDLGRALLAFAYLYFAAMLLRGVRRLLTNRGRRWYEGGTIPVIFHYVLAVFAFAFALWNVA